MLTRFSAPAATPVSLGEAKSHLRVGDDEDALIQLYLDAAVAHLDGAEGILGRCLVTQTWDWTFDAFAQSLTVPLPTLQSVTSITYRDADGATQTLSTDDYRVSGQSIHVRDIPGTDGEPGAVTVRFVAGYGNAAAVPAAIKAAILLLVGDAYANREAHGEPVSANPAVMNLLRPYRVHRV